MCNSAVHVLGITENQENNGGDDSLWLHLVTTKDQILSVLLSTSWNRGKLLKTGVTTKKNPKDLRVVEKILKHEVAMH